MTISRNHEPSMRALLGDLAHALDPAQSQSTPAASSPASLAVAASRGLWRPARHLDLINSKLLDIAAGRIKRLIVLAPPRLLSGEPQLR